MNMDTKIKSLLCTSFIFFNETISRNFSLCIYERYYFYQLNIFTIQSNVTLKPVSSGNIMYIEPFLIEYGHKFKLVVTGPCIF